MCHLLLGRVGRGEDIKNDEDSREDEGEKEEGEFVEQRKEGNRKRRTREAAPAVDLYMSYTLLCKRYSENKIDPAKRSVLFTCELRKFQLMVVKNSINPRNAFQTRLIIFWLFISKNRS